MRQAKINRELTEKSTKKLKVCNSQNFNIITKVQRP